MIFFWRRCLFIIICVYLFKYPLLQMYAHLYLTIVSIAILSQDRTIFESTA